MSDERKLNQGELLDKVEWWRKIAHIGGGCKDRNNCEQAYKQIKSLLQQKSERKIEINEKYVDMKTNELEQLRDRNLYDRKDREGFITQLISDVKDEWWCEKEYYLDTIKELKKDLDKKNDR